eukprot:3824334-Prymnesium_polylepis.1
MSSGPLAGEVLLAAQSLHREHKSAQSARSSRLDAKSEQSARSSRLSGFGAALEAVVRTAGDTSVETLRLMESVTKQATQVVGGTTAG